MAASVRDRNTPRRSGDLREPPVKAGAVIFAGVMTALDGTGFAVPAAADATLIVIGRCEQRADNREGANGDIRVKAATGVFRFDNSAGADMITRQHIGAVCYAVDDHTVAKTNASGVRPSAGTIFDVEDGAVWVRFD